MLEDLWDGFLGLMELFVIPDWGALIALLPIFVLVPVVALLALTFVRLARAKPARRGKTRIVPRTPPGIHMPGPSLAPIFASLGAFLLFLGLVFGGPVLILGAIALVLTLLYWLAEALRIYDHDLGTTAPALPAVVHEGPPPGVHMPGPSFRPFLGAVGATMLMLGLVFGGWLLAVGLIALVATLAGWLVDARREFAKTEEADRTGHLENIPPPRTPAVLLTTLAVLLVGAVALQAGWLPPGDASGGQPGASPGAPASPGTSADPGASPPPAGPEADVVLTALNVLFDRDAFTAPADTPFTIALINQDAGVPHNVELKDGSGASVFVGDIFNGVETRVYDVPALPAGTYQFLCTVHPTTMLGTATLQ
ncbi:MAG: cupredoxin domain-containing protein [Candidatus Limnocylindria bacterium]